MQRLKTEIHKDAETTDNVQEIVIGSLESGIEADGTCHVSYWYKGIHYHHSALVVGTLPDVVQHRPVAIGFANANLASPIVIGAIHVNLQSLLHTQEQPRACEKADLDNVPGSRVLEASEEIELRCGESSIRLTRSGKVLINGDYILSCSRGVNRIVGASVEVN